MRQIGALFSVLVCMVAHAPGAAADLQDEPLRRPESSLSELPTPDGRPYIPSWANLYGRMPDLGINDETQPVYPFDIEIDIDSGAN
jgi:hypothetical protein